MPSSTTSVMPSSRTPRTKSLIAGRSSSSLSAIVSQPSRSSSSGVPGGAQSVPSLRQMRRTTSSLGRLAQPLGDRLLELGRQVGLERAGAAGDDRLALGLDAATAACSSARRTPRCPSRSSWSVTSSRSIPASASAARSAAGSSAAVAPVTSPSPAAACSVGSGIVLTVSGRDEAVDVERVGIGRVLDAGRRPQRALHRAAGVAQRGELLAAEDALERLVGGARVGEPGAALEVLAAGGGQPLVDLGVDARDEERRDRVAVERQAVGLAAPHRADVRAHHVLVGGRRRTAASR